MSDEPSWQDRASALGQERVESFKHYWSEEGKRRRGSARKMGKTPVLLRARYTITGEEEIALGENNQQERESALRSGERHSLLSEGQAWSGNQTDAAFWETARTVEAQRPRSISAQGKGKKKTF